MIKARDPTTMKTLVMTVERYTNSMRDRLRWAAVKEDMAGRKVSKTGREEGQQAPGQARCMRRKREEVDRPIPVQGFKRPWLHINEFSTLGTNNGFVHSTRKKRRLRRNSFSTLVTNNGLVHSQAQLDVRIRTGTSCLPTDPTNISSFFEWSIDRLLSTVVII